MPTLRTVMLIDDDQINNFVCETIIKNEGFAEKVISYQHAKDALDHLQESSDVAVGNFPELIFLDINMPGMDGWEFIEQYRKLPDDLRERCTLFMLSSAVDRKDIMTAKNLIEVKEFFSKPLSADILHIIKEEYLN